MKTTIATLLFALASTFCLAQKVSEDGQELIDKFFEHYKNKGYEIALKYAYGTNKWIEIQGDEMDNLIINLGKQVNTMGEYLGYEEIRSRKLGSRFRTVSYLVYYMRDPVRFTFAMYKTPQGWEITDFTFDMNYDKELEESMKVSGN